MMKFCTRQMRRMWLRLVILYLRWEISTWEYGLAERAPAERKIIGMEQAIRECNLIMARAELAHL